MKTHENEEKRPKKCLFIDLDGTLTVTLNGKPFPRGVWDMKLRFEVLDAIRVMHPEFIGIVTNQGGIEEGYVDIDAFIAKMNYICSAVEEYTGVLTDYELCAVNDPNSPDRKPNTGMLQKLNHTQWNAVGDSCGPWPVEQCLMVGDASGLEGQFSDSDRRTAENYGCDYMDVDDFVQHYGSLRKGGVL